MTLLITQGATKNLVVTLSELSDPLTPLNWLFRFISDQTQKEYLTFLTDISTDTERYNSFTFIEGTDLTFDTLGDYGYYAYQMPDTDDTDYTRGTLVEVGKVRVIGTEVVNPAYDTTLNEDAYNG